MNILVTGANGQLGTELRLVAHGSQDRYLFSDVTDLPGVETLQLDMTDAQALREVVEREQITAVVNCAAYTNVDRAETDEHACRRLNAHAPALLAAEMKRVGGLLVHISTDYVFGAESYNAPCREDQQGTPTGVYGRTKLEGEQAISASGCHHLIVRTAWLYSEYGNNFLKTMLRLTAEKPQLNVVFDQTGTPTYAFDLAQAIFHVLENRLWEGHEGVYHYSNEGVASWYDFTMLIARLTGRKACDIRPCRSSEYPSPVRRPAYSVLDKAKFRKAFGLAVPYWADSVERCLRSMGVLEQQANP